jgi:hypothetical protein
MAAAAPDGAPRIEMRGVRGQRFPHNGLTFTVAGVVLWVAIALGWANPFDPLRSFMNLLFVAASVAFPAAGIYDAVRIWSWGLRAYVRIGPEGICNEDNPEPIPWTRIRSAMRQPFLIDIQWTTDDERGWDGMWVFPRAFRSWRQAEEALRYYVAKFSINNNFG